MKNRNNTKWRADEKDALLTMQRNGVSHDQIAISLGRSVAAVQNKLHELRTEGANKLSSGNGEVEADFSLMLWFVREAWQEGHAVTIPSLGATFQKGGKQCPPNQ